MQPRDLTNLFELVSGSAAYRQQVGACACCGAPPVKGAGEAQGGGKGEVACTSFLAHSTVTILSSLQYEELEKRKAEAKQRSLACTSFLAQWKALNPLWPAV